MKKRKAAAILLSLIMVMSMLAGCGQSGSGSEGDGASAAKPSEQSTAASGMTPAASETTSTTAEDKTPATSGSQASDATVAGTWDDQDIDEVTWTFWGLSATPTEEARQKVEDALNDITIPKIGVRVHMDITDVGTYMNQVSMRIVSGESIDLFTTFVLGSASFGTMMNNNQLMDITDLLAEYAPETMALLPEEMLAAASRNGRIYGVPLYNNYVSNNYWVCQKAVFDGAGLDSSAIKTLDDVHDALVKIKESYPDKIPLGGNSFVYPGGQTYEIATGQHVDAIGVPGTAYIRYEDEKEGFTVTDRYEGENFKYLVETLRQWNAEGLVDKDMAMNAADMWYLNPKIVSSFESQNSIEMASLEQAAGQEYEFIKLSSNHISNAPLLMLTSTVPVTAKSPEGAVRLLNLLYTDAKVKNLVSFGIEGEHWEFKPDGRIGFPEGIDESSCGYYLGSERIFGNVFLNYVWENMDAKIMEDEKALMDQAEYSPLIGFSFDSTPVSTEEAQLSTVKNEYFNTLLGGGGDEKTYNEFIDKLKASGMEAYQQEVQKQLDAWLAAK